MARWRDDDATVQRHQGGHPGRGTDPLRRRGLPVHDHSCRRSRCGHRPGPGDALLRRQGRSLQRRHRPRSSDSRPRRRSCGRARGTARRALPRALGRGDPRRRGADDPAAFATTDAAAAASMRVLFARQLVPALRPLVADESELPQRAGLVASQMLGLALTRSVLALPPSRACRRTRSCERRGDDPALPPRATARLGTTPVQSRPRPRSTMKVSSSSLVSDGTSRAAARMLPSRPSCSVPGR